MPFTRQSTVKDLREYLSSVDYPGRSAKGLKKADLLRMARAAEKGNIPKRASRKGKRTRRTNEVPFRDSTLAVFDLFSVDNIIGRLNHSLPSNAPHLRFSRATEEVMASCLFDSLLMVVHKASQITKSRKAKTINREDVILGATICLRSSPSTSVFDSTNYTFSDRSLKETIKLTGLRSTEGAVNALGSYGEFYIKVFAREVLRGYKDNKNKEIRMNRGRVEALCTRAGLATSN